MCIIFSLVTKSVATSTTDTGIYFLHVNELYASYRSWIIIFTYHLKPYEANIRKMHNNIQEFSKSFAQRNRANSKLCI